MKPLAVPILLLGLTTAPLAQANEYSERYDAWNKDVESRIPADLRPIYNRPFQLFERVMTNVEVSQLLLRGFEFYARGDFAVAYKLIDRARQDLVIDADRAWYDSTYAAQVVGAGYFMARSLEKVCEQSSACTDKYLGAQENPLGADYTESAKDMNEALAMVYADLAKEFSLAPVDPAVPESRKLSASDREYAVKHCEMYKKKALEQPVPADFWSRRAQSSRNPKMTICRL